MRLIPLLPLPALCFCLCATLPAADKIIIRNHYESGKVYNLENVMEMTASMPAAGVAGNQQTHVTQTMTITVKDDAGGNRLATVKFTGIKASMSMMGQTMSYDSADPAKSQPFLQQALGAMLNKEFTLVVDKDDKIVDTRGLDNLAPSPVAGAKGMDGKQLAEAFRKSMEMFLPPQPVAPGDTWNYEDKMELPPLGMLQSKGTGKFDSIVDVDGRKHAKLIITGTMSMPESAGSAMKLGMGSTVSVELLYDIDRRVTDSSTATNEIKLNAAGQDIPMKHKDVTKLTSITDAPQDAAPAPAAPAPAGPGAAK